MCEIPIVKNNDEIIKYKKRSEILENDIYRVSSLWITNSSGEVLLAKRAKIKKNHPGVWGPAVSGTVEKDETYYENILKETNEEIGLDVDFVKENISELKKDFVNGDYKHFTMWYEMKVDLDIDSFLIQKSEVDEIKWIKYEKLVEDIKINPDKYLLSLVKKIREGFFD